MPEEIVHTVPALQHITPAEHNISRVDYRLMFPHVDLSMMRLLSQPSKLSDDDKTKVLITS